MSSLYTRPELIIVYVLSVFAFIAGLLSKNLWFILAGLICPGIAIGVAAVAHRIYDKQKFTNVCTPNYA